MAQRMLTAKSPLRGSLSLILAQFISFGVVSLFLIVGLLLYIFTAPGHHGAAAPHDHAADAKQIYPQFLLNHLSPGLVGLAMAGMFAAAQGSLDSAINALASSAVADLYWPIRRKLGLPIDSSTAKSPRIAVLGMGLLLILFAVWSVFRYDSESDTILQFALGIMAFAYSGMLGVFLTALFTRRGNSRSVIAALLIGLIVTISCKRAFSRYGSIGSSARPRRGKSPGSWPISGGSRSGQRSASLSASPGGPKQPERRKFPKFPDRRAIAKIINAG